MFETIILVAALGALFGLVLAFASNRLHVEPDPLAENINELLPGANCGACGYPGCSALAEAIAGGKAGHNSCAVADANAKNKIAALLGAEPETDGAEPQTAVLQCNGCPGNNAHDYDYKGVHDCRMAARLLNAPGKCSSGCLGFGTCAEACPFNAIAIGANGLPQIDPAKCTGCGICVASCPQKVLRLLPRNAKVRLVCSNTDSGSAAMKACQSSCIGCGICARTCPNHAVTMADNLPQIDYAKCTGCGLCSQKCPRGCLIKINPPTGGVPVNMPPQSKGCAHCPLAESCGIK